MPYCPKCGTESETDQVNCRVCEFPIPDISDAKANSLYPDYPRPRSINYKEFRRICWKLGTLTLLSSFLLTLTIDLVEEGAITWSRYSMSSTVLAWFVLSFSLLLYRSPHILNLLITLCVCGFLPIIDYANGTQDWYLPLGLPLTVISGTLIGLLILFYRQVKLRYAHYMAYVFFSIILWAISIDLLSSAYIGDVNMGWSFIVIAICVPLSVLCFYLHFSLAKKLDFKRFFHL
ncbi:MAG: hypothetical protein HRT89_09690 [Lentisphaeria bacterium]|nr:DUF6320 domain-containing protein [Lentisphaeria bacterium]NQZ68332.1 hypothetical protein [Lentisphaeria bacterium]